MPCHREPAALVAAIDRLGPDAVVHHNLVLGVMLGPLCDADTWLWTDAEPSRCTLVAVQTSGRPLLLTPITPAYETALALLLQDLHSAQRPIRGFHGAPRVVRAALRCCPAGPIRERMAMLRYRQDDVEPPVAVEGGMDRFRLDETDLAAAWCQAFERAMGYHTPLSAERLRTLLPDLRCWRVADRPVSMARSARPVRDSIAVAGVYTPPEQRRQGYAGALVGALSTELREQGYRHRLLFTDAANPTSNHIYQAVGYRQIGEAETVLFND